MLKDKKGNDKMVKHVLKEKDEHIKNLQKRVEGLDYSEDIFIAIIAKEGLIEKYFDEEYNLLPGVLD